MSDSAPVINTVNDDAPETVAENLDGSLFRDAIVEDAVIEGGRFTSHVSYKVIIHTQSTKTIEIRRRYRDFDWLRKQLHSDYPGRLVPPLPPKHIPLFEDPLAAEFVESRRRGLERFLRRIMDHPELSRSKHFVDDFLGLSLEVLDEKRREQNAPVQVVSGLALAAKRQSMRLINYREFGDMEAKDIGRNEEFHTRLQLASEYIKTLLKALATVKRSATRTINDRFEYAYDLQTLGEAFSGLALVEGDGVLAEPLGQLDHALRHLSSLANLQAENERLLFEDTLRDWLGVTNAVRESLIKDQGTQRHSHQDARSELSRAIQKRDKLRQRAATQEEVREAEAQVARCEAVVHDAGQSLSTVKKLLFEEMSRFNEEKSAAFEEMIYNLVESHIEFTGKELAAWEAVRAKLPKRFGGHHDDQGPVATIVRDGDNVETSTPDDVPVSPTPTSPVGKLDLSPPVEEE